MKDIGWVAFQSCVSLTSLDIPNSVTSIASYAFTGCKGLTSISLPNGIKTIENNTFYNCNSLTIVTIPETVTSIGNSAFSGCTNLSDVYCYAENAPTCSSDAFEQVYEEYNRWDYAFYINATLHVHYNALERYKGADTWNEFRYIVDLENISEFSLTYYVDKEIYKQYKHKYKDSIIPEPNPTKEGYTFSGWSEIPETMPGKDIVVTGSFIPNNYILTYIVDGVEYKSSSVACGTTLTPEEEPTKEGYIFSGWSDIPDTMPAHDVTVTGSFTINQYTITFDSNGGTPIESITQDYNSTITPPEDPTREGYTFLGWEPAIPKTMPSNGLTVKAQWQANTYALVYYVDGVEYSRSEVEYGTRITPKEGPSKEGYTFSGWDNVPATMPAHDVTVTGSFTINSYTLTYKIDGAVYKTSTIAYGTALTPETEPTKEGYTFSGWDDVPETMPAHDVVVTGSFSINSYFLFYVLDGGIYKAYNIKYGTVIVPETEPDKEGYLFSGWSEIPATMPDHDVVVHGNFYLYGDVNGDDKVDLSDAIMVTYYSLHQIPAKFNEAVADMNDDGEIDLSDAIIIIYKSLGVK